MAVVLGETCKMKKSTEYVLKELVERYPKLQCCYEDISSAIRTVISCYEQHHKLLLCGNGGSAADSEHIVGELMKGFVLQRPLDREVQEKLVSQFPLEANYFLKNLQGALPAISLVNQISLNSAFSNDRAPDLSFAQQILALGEDGDILLAISTSGNSKNIIYAAQIAKIKNVKTISLTGQTGGMLREFSNICICAPSNETYKIQEYHLPIYHAICLAVENEFFGEGEGD